MSKRKAKGGGTIYYRKDRQQYCGQVVIGTNPKTGKLIRKTFISAAMKKLSATN